MSSIPKVIYVMGPPGAGKGTQAELLANAIGYYRFSTGAAFREVSRQPTELGKKVKDLIDNGVLCPPALAAEVVITAIRDHLKSGKGLVFDGTPRTVEEARLVDEFFQKSNYGRPLAVVLTVQKEEMIRRNSRRRFCLGIVNDFPINDDADRMRCQAAGGEIGMRPDDAPPKQLIRWDQFQENTAPVIKKYQEEGIAKEINGEQPIEKVHRDIMQLL